MSLLKKPEARALLKDAKVLPGTVAGCRGRLQNFLMRYLPLWERKEQRGHATLAVEGRLSGLERKTTEPIAYQAGAHRKPLQNFVGASSWDDEAIMAELRRHVAEELGHPEAVLILDGSGFPKKGTESCGVDRQWCGRLGKVENCQVGVFLVYASSRGHAPLDRRLYLRAEWAADAKRRKKCHVPPTIVFQEKWQIGLKQLEQANDLPHRWLTADDEFGRVVEFRRGLQKQGKSYVLDVPANTWVRDLEARKPRRRAGQPRRKRKVPFVRVDQWAARQPRSRWRKFRVRDGEKGPLEVEVLTVRVHTKANNRVNTTEERLLVVRSFVQGKPELSYALSNADAGVLLRELVRVKIQRHRVEEVFQQGKGEVGLGHYEVRSWVGWHHHMTLSLLALWFLVLERREIGGKNSGHHRRTGAGDLLSAAPTPGSEPRRHSQGNHPRLAA